MTVFTDLVRSLLEEGSVRLREPPQLPDEEHHAVRELLASAFTDHRLDVAGPAIPFAPERAIQAVEWFAWSCWFLLHRGEPDQEVARRLKPLPAPVSAAEHLSGDLLFRFLPRIYRRARAVNPRDPLTLRLEDTLRRWPLSGVLAEIEEPPLSEVELAGHPGLLLLYAERLMSRPRPAWLPGPAGMPFVELVFGERGLRNPFPRPPPRSGEGE
jgi:hypothetical protein